MDYKKNNDFIEQEVKNAENLSPCLNFFSYPLLSRSLEVDFLKKALTEVLKVGEINELGMTTEEYRNLNNFLKRKPFRQRRNVKTRVKTKRKRLKFRFKIL